MKLRDVIIGFSVIAVGMFFLFGDDGDGEVKKQNTPAVHTKTLKLAHNLPTDSALHEATVKFAEEIDKKLDGKIKVEIYPAQKLGNDHEMVEMARGGEIDMILTPTAKLSVAVPAMQFVDLPFIFPTREDAYAILDGEVGEILLKKLDAIDLLGVAFWENGFKHFTGNFEIKTPDDFKDKNIRVMKSRIIIEQFKALEANPIPIDFHSTKQALSDGVVDGQENPLMAIVSMGFHEVQSHLTISQHAYLAYAFSFSKKSIEKLSAHELNILIETAKEITSFEREKTQAKEKELLEIVKKQGVKIDTLSAKQRAKFAQKTEHIISLFEDTIGSDVISATHEYLYTKYPPKDSVVIGLNVDLSSHQKGAGFYIKAGAELAVDEINKNGGVLGKNLILLAKDTKASAASFGKNLRYFKDLNNTVAVVGGKLSAVVFANVDEIKKSNIPLMLPWASASVLTDKKTDAKNIFRVSLNDKFAVRFLVEQTILNHKKPLFLLESSVWGDGAKVVVDKIFQERGLGKPSIQMIKRDERDMQFVADAIAKNHNDSLCIVLNNKEVNNILDTLIANNIKIPIKSHWGILGGGFFQKNKEYLLQNDFQFLETFTFSKKDKKILNLKSNFKNKYAIEPDTIEASHAIAQAYDSVMLVAEAIKKANSIKSDEVIKALEDIKRYDGALKRYIYPFSKDNHDALDKNDLFLTKFNESGIIVPVKER